MQNSHQKTIRRKGNDIKLKRVKALRYSVTKLGGGHSNGLFYWKTEAIVVVEEAGESFERNVISRVNPIYGKPKNQKLIEQ